MKIEKLFVKPIHNCEAFQKAEDEGIIDSTILISDSEEKYSPYCIFSYGKDGQAKVCHPIKFCPFCGQNLNTLPAIH